MNFWESVGRRIRDYVALRRGLGLDFTTQARTLKAFGAHLEAVGCRGPLTQQLAVDFVNTRDVTPETRARRYGVVRLFAAYLSTFDPRTETLDPRALPRMRRRRPVRIPTDAELSRLLAAARSISVREPLRGIAMHAILGLLACTGMRTGEVVRLDRTDVDLKAGVITIRRSKFRKDRLVPIHATTCRVLRAYACARDARLPSVASPAFFLNLRCTRLGQGGLGYGFHQAQKRAGTAMRPSDLRHRFAVRRLEAWHRNGRAVQAMLPLLATYLGHVRYTDTAWYVTATADLLRLASARLFRALEPGRRGTT